MVATKIFYLLKNFQSTYSKFTSTKSNLKINFHTPHFSTTSLLTDVKPTKVFKSSSICALLCSAVNWKELAAKARQIAGVSCANELNSVAFRWTQSCIACNRINCWRLEMLAGVLDKLWRFLCCSSTVDDHTEHEVRKRANEADTEEFYVSFWKVLVLSLGVVWFSEVKIG